MSYQGTEAFPDLCHPIELNVPPLCALCVQQDTATYDIFSLYHELYPMGTNMTSSHVPSSIPIPSPPQQKAPSTQKQCLPPTLPSSSSHTPYSAEWIRGHIHEDPSLALHALK